MNIFFNYSLDCETPANTPYTGATERRPFFHGPPTWDFAESSVRGFVEQMQSLDALRGASLFVYPDVARHQKRLYREVAEAGVEVALHLNGLRYSRLTGERAKWLGEMSYQEQRDALAMGKKELEEVTGRRCGGYRACYGSANNETFPILEELGFIWASNASGRYRPEFAANWAGSWPYTHRAHRKSNLIPGDMQLFEIPVTRGLRIFYDQNPDQPLDLRVETPPEKLGGEQRAIARQIIEENVVEMQRRGVLVRAIIGASHNTSRYNDRSTHQAQNLDWIVRHAREVAAAHEHHLIPASFGQMLEEAQRVDAW